MQKILYCIMDVKNNLELIFRSRVQNDDCGWTRTDGCSSLKDELHAHQGRRMGRTVYYSRTISPPNSVRTFSRKVCDKRNYKKRGLWKLCLWRRGGGFWQWCRVKTTLRRLLPLVGACWRWPPGDNVEREAVTEAASAPMNINYDHYLLLLLLQDANMIV